MEALNSRLHPAHLRMKLLLTRLNQVFNQNQNSGINKPTRTRTVRYLASLASKPDSYETPAQHLFS